MVSAVSRPKLAYLGSSIPSLSATFIYREIIELQARGIEIRIYSLWKPPTEEVLSTECMSLIDKVSYLQPVSLGQLLWCHGYYLARSPWRYTRALWKMVFGVAGGAKARIRGLLHFGEGVVLARRAQLDQVTHFHAHYASQPASVARVVHLLTGIPYSFSAHAYDIWHDPLLLAQKLRECVFVACCSIYGKQKLAAYGTEADRPKIHVIYHGIDVRRFVPPGAATRQTGYVLAVGRLDPIKGFRHLISACHILKDRHATFQCYILGEGEERVSLTAQIRECDLEGVVRLVGAVPQEKLLDYYHSATMFVMPSVVTDSGNSDGIPNVLLEAMATELPVIATPVAGIPELVTHFKDGILAAPGDPEELAHHIHRLLQDSAQRKTLGAAARRRVVADFDNRNAIEPLITLFEQEVGISQVRAPQSARTSVR